MSTVLILVIILIVLVVGASLFLGRQTYEVDSARDTEYLELEGNWIRYNVTGGGPPVVLVHGWLSSSAVWDQLAGRLAQRFTVYTLDLTGFGDSDKPSDGYGIRYGSRLLFAFCAHFGLQRATIIGQDLGGDMAIKLASDQPDVVGKIVLIGTPANEEQIDLPTPLWAATLPVIGPVFYALGRAVRPVRSMWMRPFFSEPNDLTEEVVEDAGKSTPRAMSQTLNVARREIAGGRLARQARMIKVPALIVAGEEDRIVDPQAAGVWARSLDHADVCLMDECGHMPMIERTAEFNAQILAFLTGDARYLEYADQQRAGTLRGEEEETQILEEDDTQGISTVPPEGDAPAFGPAPGEEPAGEVRRPPRRPRRSDRDESDLSGTDYDGGVRKGNHDPDELGDETTEQDWPEEPRPVVRRLGDRFSGRRRFGRRPEEDPEGFDEHTGAGEEEEGDRRRNDASSSRNQPTGDLPAGSSREDRARRRRASYYEESGSVPELPRDLFDWGSALDDFEPPPRRNLKRGESVGDEGNHGSNGSSDKPPRP